MDQWVTQTDRFLDLNEMAILTGPGKVARDHMRAITDAVYKQYDKGRRELELLKAEQEAQEDVETIAAEAYQEDLAELTQAEEDLQRHGKAGS